MNNWPYPDKPGVPLNPEKDGWHFVERQKEITAIEWISGEWWTGGLGTYGGGYYNSEYIGPNYTYLGPCLPPSEVAAQVEQARRDGIEAAMRVVSERASARHKEAGSCISDRSRKHMHIRADEAGQIVTRIRSLLPGGDE